MLIEARGLDFAYKVNGRLTSVLRQVSFGIEAGEYVAIQGPSGSGKSTLFYILGCLLKPTAGQVLLGGVDVGQLSDDLTSVVRNQMIGFVFQQFHLLARADVMTNILLPAAYPLELPRPWQRLQSRRDDAFAVATRLGLGARLAQLPSQLSGGEQQRIAVARALLNNADVILADEPTGNLDSANTREILSIFDELHAQGRTVVIITHDPDIARHCHRVLQVRDGSVTDLAPSTALARVLPSPGRRPEPPPGWNKSLLRLAYFALPTAGANLLRDRTKSVLTMLGIVIGIAAVLTMISLGQFTRQRIVEGFEVLGVNKLVVRGYPNLEREATEVVPRQFVYFDWKKDLLPLRQVLPAIRLLSPILINFQNTVTSGGRSVSEGVRLLGIGYQYLAITNAHLAAGRTFTPYNEKGRARICILGAEVADKLFGRRLPLGEVVTIAIAEQSSFPCRVTGVLAPQKSNDELLRPDLQILIPYTTFQTVASFWSGRINDFTVQVRRNSDVEKVAKELKGYFRHRYGKAGKFIVDTEGTLVAQAKRFLKIFVMLLTAIALLALLIGGIGIHNMMLVSVTERIKEIGLRKALGATNRSIKMQVLTESLILCTVGGVLGLAAGFGATELMIWAASKFVVGLNFEWIVDPWAFAFSVGSIIAVGLASGLAPARRAEKLEVIEALRAE